jgi:hypothetical protein
MQRALQQWLEGAGITEYPHSGQESDVFHVIYNGTTIIVEIIWADGYTHFLEDLDIIQNSNASVNIIIVNPTILNKEKFVHHYDKIRVAEFVKGYLVSRLIDGSKILNDTNYLDKTVREIVLGLLEHVSVDPAQSAGHFIDLKDKVINPALILIERQPEKLPSATENANYIQGVDIGLLSDLLKNHYPTIASIWDNVVKSYQKKNKTDNKINEIIETAIINTLDEIGLKYKASMYDLEDSNINAIPIKEVRERLREMIENKTFEHEIEKKLTVRCYASRCVILFFNEQHHDIYSVEEDEKSKDKADEIRSELKQTFTKINSCKDIHDYMKKKNDLAVRSESFRKELDSTLRRIISKTNLNIVPQCNYLKPGLE